MSKEQNQDYQINEQMIDNLAEEEIAGADAEKLREMSKKLPQWSLEPPKTFLK